MRIEDITSENLKKADNKELLILKLRFTQLWDKNFQKNADAVVGSLNRGVFLNRYRLLLKEMSTRDLEHSTCPIDRAAFKKAMDLAKFGIDVTDLGEVVLSSDFVVIGSDIAKGLKEATNVELSFEGLLPGYDDTIVESLQKQFNLPIISGDCQGEIIPLFDLVLRPKPITVVTKERAVDISKPYPNQHAARLKSPDTAHIRVGTTEGSGKGTVQGVKVPSTISIIWYVVQTGGKEVPVAQALRFSTKDWSADEAKKWLSDNSIKYMSFEPAKKLEKAIWSAKYINDLPDSYFLYIESGGEKDEDKKTKPRSLRHFPYKDASGKVDYAHLRNALGRIPQSSLPATVREEIQNKAKKLFEEFANVKKFEKDLKLVPIGKEDSDEHLVCGVVYEPDIVDAQGDKASEEEIRKAAYRFMEEYQIFKVSHQGDEVKVKVLENYIAPVDFTLAKQPIKKGSWIQTLRILDEDVWKAIKKGELTGYSMAGYARAE